MKKKIRAIIAVFIVGAVVSGNAFAYFACDTNGRSNLRHKDKMETIAKDLTLTADQEKKVKESKEAFRGQAKYLRLKLKEKRLALQAELSKPEITRQQLEPIVAEIKALQSDMVEQRLDGVFKIKEILTPEQFAKLQAKNETWCKSGDTEHRRKGR